MKRIFTVLVLLIGLGALVTPAALAQSGDQFCNGTTICVDAWNGGPQINVYPNNGGNNELFTNILNANNTAYVQIEFTGGGGDTGDCIGDYGNSSSDARAGMVGGCGGSGIGWGGNWGTRFCDGTSGAEFYNVHWNGWLTYSGSGPGSAFYLNGAEPVCYLIH